MNILVTGAAGFIGSNLASRLYDSGFNVVGLDNFNDYYPVVLKKERVNFFLKPNKIECVNIDLCDNNSLNKLFKSFRPDKVIHLGAQAGVRYSISNPSTYVQSNIVGHANILELCKKYNISELIYASSSSVYGLNSEVPFRETHRTDNPISLYAASKKSNELMTQSYSHLFNMKATGLRFFTVYGPWGRPDMAYFSFANNIMKGIPITVFEKGMLKRDFTYIDDIVMGILKLIDCNYENDINHRIINIGNENPVLVKNFIRVLENSLNKKAIVKYLPMQAGDVRVTYADTSLLESLTGYKPKIKLKEGLKMFSDWYLNHGVINKL
jgi:UDP-glucuronate 4-epimerase